MDCSPPGPRSWGFFRQEYWSGLPFSSPGDLPNPGTEPRSPTMQVDSLPSEPPTKPYVKWGIWAGWPQRYWSVPKILCWKNIHEMTWELANSSGHLCTTKYGRLWKQGTRFLCVCVCVCVCVFWECFVSVHWGGRWKAVNPWKSTFKKFTIYVNTQTVKTLLGYSLLEVTIFCCSS